MGDVGQFIYVFGFVDGFDCKVVVRFVGELGQGENFDHFGRLG